MYLDESGRGALLGHLGPVEHHYLVFEIKPR